ncbi:hypothetical protein Tco_1209679 [Tanacetum coccineum]
MLTECGDSDESINRCRRDLSRDDVRELTTASGQKGEDGPEWVVRNKFEDELANFMLDVTHVIWAVSVIVSLLWIVDSERDRLIVVDRGTRSVPLFVRLRVTVSTWFGVLLLAWRYYAFSESLLLTPLCCDDIHDVTPRVSTLAGCDRLVSEPLVIG